MNQRDKWLKALWHGILLAFLGVVFYCMGITMKAGSDNVASKTSAPSTQNYGKYYLFETTKPEEYLEFLEEFNVQKNNITIKAGGSWIAVQLPSAFVIHFTKYIF